MKTCISSIWSLSVESRIPRKTKTTAEINNAIANAFILPPALIILKLCVVQFNITGNKRAPQVCQLLMQYQASRCVYVIRKLPVGFDKTGLLQFDTYV